MKTVNYYPLYEGLACIIDGESQVLVLPQYVEEVLALDYIPSSNNNLGDWYVYMPIKFIETRYNQVSSNFFSRNGQSITRQYTPVMVEVYRLDEELGQNQYEINIDELSKELQDDLQSFGRVEYKDNILEF